MSPSADLALRTTNCAIPCCALEAEPGTDRCAEHGGVKPHDPMERLRAMYGPDPEHAPRPYIRHRQRRTR